MRIFFRYFTVFVLLCALITGCSGSESMTKNDQSQQINQDNYDEQDVSEGVAGEEDYGADEDTPDALLDMDDSDVPLKAADEDMDTADQAGASGSTSASRTTQQEEQDTAAETASETKKATKEEKLVYTCDLSIETTTYKETMDQIRTKIKKYSGIIESQYEYDRASGWYRSDYQKTSGTMEATIVVRIPSAKYQDFLASLDGTGKMTNKSMNVTNISRTYYDTKTYIESLQIQEKRLLKMMDEAKTIEDMITVEKRLTEVQTQLNQYKNQLSSMDTEVAYSTVTMDIQEVMEYKPAAPGRKTNTFSQRFMNNLKDSWSGFLSFMEGLLFLIIRLLPFLIILGLLWIVSRPLRRRFAVWRSIRKNSKERKTSTFKKKEKSDSLS